MQARTETFENGEGCEFKVFTKWGANLNKILILRPPWFHSTVGTKLRSNHCT